jgi:large subunit ribosomal protein L3
MKFLLGIKKEMSQKFTESGAVVPVTAIQAGPCQVTQVKALQQDGYLAVQVGMGHKNKITKALQGHLKDMDNFRYLREFRIKPYTNDTNGDAKDANEITNLKRGDKLDVSIFQPGDKLQITGTSKGKGFQGVVKRHGFHGAPATHGHKDQLRMPGSIGATAPARVFKGTRMGGHMGAARVTIKEVEIVEVDKGKSLLWVKGPVPGAFNSLVLLSSVGELSLEAPKEDKSEITEVDVKTENTDAKKEQEEKIDEAKFEVKSKEIKSEEKKEKKDSQVVK